MFAFSLCTCVADYLQGNSSSSPTKKIKNDDWGKNVHRSEDGDGVDEGVWKRQCKEITAEPSPSASSSDDEELTAMRMASTSSRATPIDLEADISLDSLANSGEVSNHGCDPSLIGSCPKDDLKGIESHPQSTPRSQPPQTPPPRMTPTEVPLGNVKVNRGPFHCALLHRWDENLLINVKIPQNGTPSPGSEDLFDMP